MLEKFNKRDIMAVAGTVGLALALLTGGGSEETATQIAHVIGTILTVLGYGGASVVDAESRNAR